MTFVTIRDCVALQKKSIFLFFLECTAFSIRLKCDADCMTLKMEASNLQRKSGKKGKRPKHKNVLNKKNADQQSTQDDFSVWLKGVREVVELWRTGKAEKGEILVIVLVLFGN